MGNQYKHKKNTNSIYNDYQDSKRENKRKGETLKYPTSIINISKMTAKKMIYPTEKPVKLLEYLIKTYTNEGDLVLDNCMGSGSTEAFEISKARLT